MLSSLKKKFLFALVLVFSLAVTVYAEDSGVYIDASVGRSDINESGFDKGTSVSFGLGYSFNEYFSTEVRYIDFGDFDDDIFPVWTISGDAFVFNIVGKYPVTDRFSVFAKLGFFAWDAEVKEQGFGKLGSDDGTDITYGAGLSFLFAEKIASYVQFQRYEFKIDGENIDLDDISVGLQYRF
ncbi:MAG: porin family protein [Desulfuromonadales bacterium]|nr:porin family protein [Desulfuromonadales bacterium]